jgi:hypothetical protein
MISRERGWAVLLELGLKVYNFTFELSDDLCILGDVVFDTKHISFNFRFDIFSPIGIFKGVMCVFVVQVTWGDVGNHHSSTVTS